MQAFTVFPCIAWRAQTLFPFLTCILLGYYGNSPNVFERRLRNGPVYVDDFCCCLAIPSMLTAERKCPHDGACEIDAARTGKTSGTQQLTGWIYDDGAGSDTDGTERTPYQAHTGGIQGEGSSRNSSRQQRSQPCQCRAHWRSKQYVWLGPDTPESTTRT